MKENGFTQKSQEADGSPQILLRTQIRYMT